MKSYIRPLFFVSISFAAVLFFLIFLNGLSDGFVISASSDGAASIDKREEAYRANNRGVAQLEQFNYADAEKEFRHALAIDPKMKIAQINLAIALYNSQEIEQAFAAAKTAAELAPELPNPKYLLGLIARSTNRFDDAVKLFEEVLTADRRDVGSNINLGQIFMQQSDYKKAVDYLKVALDAEPYNSTAMYNLATSLIRTGSRDEGKELLNRFQELKKSGAATNLGQNYLEQGRYAEGLTSTGAETELVDKSEPGVVFKKVDIGLPSGKIESDGAASKNKSAAVLFDFDNDRDLDLVVSRGDRSGIGLFRNDKGRYTDITATSGDLLKAGKREISGIIAGDYDNDDLIDLFMFGKESEALFRNTGNGAFEDVTTKAAISVSAHVPETGAFVDADHDGDLDIFLGGSDDGKNKPASSSLLRNNGDGTFLDISATAGVNSPGRDVAVIPTDYDNRRDIDFLVLKSGKVPSLLRNLRNGSFKDVAADVGLTESGNWTSAAAADFNKDSFTDFFFGKSDGPGVFAVSDGQGSFVLKNAPEGTENTVSSQFIDYDNDGLIDLFVVTKRGFAVVRNLGNVWSQADTSPFDGINAQGSTNKGLNQIYSGDIDSDGDIDLFTFDRSGSPYFLDNIGGNAKNSESIVLQGRASNKTGIGAKIDMRAGSLTQKLESYSASPSPAPVVIHFGLGERKGPDAVRIIWPSGTVQAELSFEKPDPDQAGEYSRPKKIEELDRKPSSCPYLYTWNGERFEFITDFLGGGEMGNWQEAGMYHYPDSDEFVRITSDQLKPKDGKYELRVTNELEEVLFLDHMKLVAVEHDSAGEVYPNEGLGIPTFGKQILYTSKGEHAPLAALDSEGRDVRPEIEKLDRRFYDSFKRQNIQGYVDTHQLTLNLDGKIGFRGRTLLLLTGWTDYAFSSNNLAASQSGRSLFLPKLQVKNAAGEWQTVIESIGISVGRPQTVVVDLTGKFLTDSREVRIVTNFMTFWDKIAVDTSIQTPIKIKPLMPVRADLRERGYSEEIKIGGMLTANYDKVLNDGRWKYFPGSFTRTGAVDPLLKSVDDIFVISKIGDELVLSFDALPEPPKGRKYTFLLYADGYSKEMDINSGSPDAVYPLPFKAMKKYPYGDDEKYPMNAVKQRMYEQYTTRVVKGLWPSLESYLLK